jgi:hypothetical protein
MREKKGKTCADLSVADQSKVRTEIYWPAL